MCCAKVCPVAAAPEREVCLRHLQLCPSVLPPLSLQHMLQPAAGLEMVSETLPCSGWPVMTPGSDPSKLFSRLPSLSLCLPPSLQPVLTILLPSLPSSREALTQAGHRVSARETRATWSRPAYRESYRQNAQRMSRNRVGSVAEGSLAVSRQSLRALA